MSLPTLALLKASSPRRSSAWRPRREAISRISRVTLPLRSRSYACSVRRPRGELALAGLEVLGLLLFLLLLLLLLLLLENLLEDGPRRRLRVSGPPQPALGLVRTLPGSRASAPSPDPQVARPHPTGVSLICASWLMHWASPTLSLCLGIDGEPAGRDLRCDRKSTNPE